MAQHHHVAVAIEQGLEAIQPGFAAAQRQVDHRLLQGR